MDSTHSVQSTQAKRSRLEPLQERSLNPWRKAEGEPGCHLYWMPYSYPSSYARRQWALRFLTHLRQRVMEASEALPHLFLQMKVIYPELSDVFIRSSTEFAPVMGLSRRRGAAMPKLPDAEYIEALQKGKVAYDHKAMQPDYCYWFLQDEVERQTELFFGYGGLALLFARPQASGLPSQMPTIPSGVAKHPQFAPLLQGDAMGKMMRMLQRMSSPIFEQSKLVFGKGLEEDLSFRGLKFIVPLLQSSDFFAAAPAEVAEWFTVFDVAMAECPADRGLLLASKEDLPLDSLLAEILTGMEDAGDEYPELI